MANYAGMGSPLHHYRGRWEGHTRRSIRRHSSQTNVYRLREAGRRMVQRTHPLKMASGSTHDCPQTFNDMNGPGNGQPMASGYS